MRDILFRGKRVDNGEWIEGLIWKKKSRDGKRIFISHFPDDDDYETRDVVGIKTVGQYTGFTDKNGKKIFEGDIVTLSYTGDNLYAVIWAEDQARFLLTDGETVEDFDDFYVFETEIVGNIHDNPDIAPKSEV